MLEIVCNDQLFCSGNTFPPGFGHKLRLFLENLPIDSCHQSQTMDPLLDKCVNDEIIEQPGGNVTCQ